MDWILKYSKKGSNIIQTEHISTHFTNRIDVIRWWSKIHITPVDFNYSMSRLSFHRSDYVVHGVHNAANAAQWHMEVELGYLLKMWCSIEIDIEYLGMIFQRDLTEKEANEYREQKSASFDFNYEVNQHRQYRRLQKSKI